MVEIKGGKQMGIYKKEKKNNEINIISVFEGQWDGKGRY